MGQYIRVLAEHDKAVAVSELRRMIKEKSNSAVLEIEEGDEENWSSLLLCDSDETEIAAIERNPVVRGGLGTDEIAEFQAELRDALPRSAALWLADRLTKVHVIYAFQLLDVDSNKRWEAVSTLFDGLRLRCHGLGQADGQGFFNHNGSQIIWQFPDNQEGEWEMAVLGPNGDWVTFCMELGNLEQRQAFLAGQVPKGVKPSPTKVH